MEPHPTHNPCYTDYVQRNLTLTIDEDLLREARKLALEQNTSVNQMVREYLAEAIQKSKRSEEEKRRESVERLEEIFRTMKVEVGERTWTRDELHER